MTQFKVQRALITGSAGLVGSHIAAQLLRSGCWDVHCVVRNEGSKSKLSGFLSADKVKIHIADLEDFSQVQNLIKTVDADVVFNAAAKVSVGDRRADDIVSVNVDITHFVAKSMLEHGRGLLVHISSIAALGHRSVPQKIDEDCAIDSVYKLSPYGLSKFLSENELWRAVKMGLDAVVINPSVILGFLKGSNTEQLIKVVSRKMPFYTAGVMGFVDVRDVARAAELLAKDKSLWGRRYCVNGWNVEYRDLIEQFSGHRPWFCVPRWLLVAVIWTIKILCKLVGRKPILKPDMVSFLTAQSLYDGSKIEEVLKKDDFEYHAIDNCVQYIKGQMV